jgi:hypothetical protein
MWQRLLEQLQRCPAELRPGRFVLLLRRQHGQFARTSGQVRGRRRFVLCRWAGPSRAFHQRYLDELLRKAALFPQIGSEVALFWGAERNGEECNDRLFLLTFDSGPTARPGTTDWLTDYLRKQSMSATFFVLGNSLQVRLDKTGERSMLQALYKGSAWVSGLGIPFPQPLGRLAKLDPAQRVAWSRHLCRTTTCRCSARPMGNVGQTAGVFFRARACRWRCGISMPRTWRPQVPTSQPSGC